MRRQEFQVEDEREIESFLAEASFGVLATVRPDGSPSATPLNFAYHNGAVYFHGSRVGEKMASLAEDNRVAFSVAREYAVIPSYFLDPALACPATSYFKSVLMTGRAEIVTDLREKAEALEAMMRKLQPEGGYDPIRADDERYAPQLKAVAVVKLVPEAAAAKFKFGQNLKEAKRAAVLEGLAQRDKPLDEATRRLMMQYCPHAQTGGDHAD